MYNQRLMGLMARRWLSGVAALIAVVLLTGNVGQIAHAQPGEPRVPFTAFVFEMKVSKIEDEETCVGDRVYIKVDLTYHTRNLETDLESGTIIATGIGVQGKVTNPNIGSLRPDYATTGEFGGVKTGPGTAKFTFIAAKPGSTTVGFRADIPQQVSGLGGAFPKGLSAMNGIDVTVSECNLEVDTRGDWNIPGPLNVRISGTMNRAVMKADEQGNYTGSGSVNWNGSMGSVGTCSGTLDIGSSRVDLTGQRSDSGQIALQMNFLSAAAESDVDCTQGVGGTRNETMTPDALSFSIPSSGGALTLTQGLSGAGVSTSLNIWVTKKESSGTGSSPGSQGPVAQSPPVWQATLWDQFAWLMGF